MLPEVAWAIPAEEDGHEPVYFDLRVVAPILAGTLSDEVFAQIAEELDRHRMRAVRVRIAPDEPTPERPPGAKITSFADLLARSDQRRATTNIKKISDDSRRRVSKEERKRAS